ncbi:MAG: RagB/SusD family nutrient uptake outer membrane protein [Muribaculaceae bacterium]|nr:RagB/SusD family nutrient uptake outer membrane protein [Muribaculaceae bacterium]
MKKIFKPFAAVALALLASMTMTSCEDYLDKEPDSDVSPETPFKDFTNLQGYIEEIYNCIPNKAQCYWTSIWNLGDDEIQNPQADGIMLHQVDLGNYWAWTNNDQFWFASNRFNPTSNNPFDHRLYGNAWYCIAKVNKALESIDELFTGTAEEKNMLLGQLYFFRAWWHFEMMEYLGGLPYVDRVIPAGESPRLPRESYLECAEKVADDFQKAADLLPVDWDNTTVGKRTLGKNELRINKITALAYLGKNYLWAASPLMQHGAQKGGGRTYDYNQDLAAKAAQALGQIIDLQEKGQTQYEFASFDYENIYDHTKAKNVDYSYSEIFFTTGRSWLQPGGKEAILRGPSAGWSFTRYNYSRTFGPNALCAQDNHIHQPTANYVNNYGMANGLPIDDPESGYDPNYPFKDRDPRFYHDIVFDGMEYIKAKPDAGDANMKYAGLATGGSMRAVENASRTGYFYQKLVPHVCQKYDGGSGDDYGPNPHAYIPYLRLADVYLMYAEATAVLGGPSGKSSNCSLTSVDALNVLRDRCGAGHVNAKFSGNAYMDEVRRERAVELSFEGFRFNDLQRWLLLTEPKYTVKTSAEFIRVDGADETYFAENDPRNARVAEYHEEVILQRNFDAKHYWFPLLRDDTYIYAEFEQNPGW